MLSQRKIRFQKQKIIGGSFLKNVYVKGRKVISTGSKILNRIPTGVKSEIKKTVLNKIPKAALNPILLKLFRAVDSSTAGLQKPTNLTIYNSKIT